MGLLFCIFLIILGIMGAGSLLAEKAPALKDVVAKLLEYQEIIGVIGLVLGFLSLFMWLISLHYVFYFPVRVLLALISILLELGLGLIFGLSFLRKNVFKDPASPLLLKLESARARILARQKEMGVAAMIMGVIYLFMSFA